MSVIAAQPRRKAIGGRSLEYFSSATQIGMTATPKETKYVSNIDYFGEPVYVYSLKKMASRMVFWRLSKSSI